MVSELLNISHSPNWARYSLITEMQVIKKTSIVHTFTIFIVSNENRMGKRQGCLCCGKDKNIFVLHSKFLRDLEGDPQSYQ